MTPPERGSSPTYPREMLVRGKGGGRMASLVRSVTQNVSATAGRAGSQLQGSRTTSAAARGAAEENGCWVAHERAVLRAGEGAEASQRIDTIAAKHRAAVDGIADRVRAISTRAQELVSLFSRVAEVFGRLALVALNAG